MKDEKEETDVLEDEKEEEDEKGGQGGERCNGR